MLVKGCLKMYSVERVADDVVAAVDVIAALAIGFCLLNGAVVLIGEKIGVDFVDVVITADVIDLSTLFPLFSIRTVEFLSDAISSHLSWPIGL